MADLRAIARQAMLDEGFAPDLPPDAAAEAQALVEWQFGPDAGRDLRALLWSSIDNIDSRDLDQIEYAERQPNGDIRLLVGIADVDALAPAGSAIDRHAAENTTSVYAGVATFPMLPARLSTDLTSLAEGEDRPAIVIEFLVAENGTLRSSTVYRAAVHNHARLDYESVGAWLEGGVRPPRVGATPGLAEQLRLQDEAAERLGELRVSRGALDLETIEANVITANGDVVDLTVRHKTRARYLIENLMIAANGVMAELLEQGGRPAIQRIVRAPERWPRLVELAESYGGHLPPEPDARALADFMARRRRADPDGFPDLSLAVVKLLGSGEYAVVGPGVESAGHFGLAVQDYTHATAPNRRYADLLIQRLLKAQLAGQPAPYSAEELAALAARCTERDKAAKKVERRMRKYAAVALMRRRIGQVFEAIVTGASPKGTYVRLLAPPVEGRVVRGEAGMDVGDRERVRLVGVDEDRGFIDFARV
jgi:exoribonuclease-2